MRDGCDPAREVCDTSPLSDGDCAPLCALESAAGYVGSRHSASGDAPEGQSEFASAFAALLDWGQRHDLIRPESEFPVFSRERTDCGNEHEVWYDTESNCWFKATYPNRFGCGWTSPGGATAEEYLNRLCHQNDYFGDQIELVALVESGGKLRVLTKQPHVAGSAATPGEIEAWFLDLEFRRVTAGGSLAWYNRADNLLIADAHEGNLIKDGNGYLIPIDLNIIRPTGALLEWALSACAP